MDDFDWETWLIEDGHSVIEKEVSDGAGALTSAERLTYCLWVADYGMRNAGDLDTAADLYPDFQTEGLALAQDLDLPKTAAAFGLAKGELEKVYFDRFAEICAEVASTLNRGTAK